MVHCGLGKLCKSAILVLISTDTKKIKVAQAKKGVSMKKTNKLTAFSALALLSMMFTSCKAVIGGGDMPLLYIITNIAIVIGFFAFDSFMDSKLDARYGKPTKAPAGKSFAIISGLIEFALIVLMFLFRPFARFNIFVLAVLFVLLFIDKIIKKNNRKKNAAPSILAKNVAPASKAAVPQSKSAVSEINETKNKQEASENNETQNQQEVSENSASQTQQTASANSASQSQQTASANSASQSQQTASANSASQSQQTASANSASQSQQTASANSASQSQ